MITGYKFELNNHNIWKFIYFVYEKYKTWQHFIEKMILCFGYFQKIWYYPIFNK